MHIKLQVYSKWEFVNKHKEKKFDRFCSEKSNPTFFFLNTGLCIMLLLLGHLSHNGRWYWNALSYFVHKSRDLFYFSETFECSFIFFYQIKIGSFFFRLWLNLDKTIKQGPTPQNIQHRGSKMTICVRPSIGI